MKLTVKNLARGSVGVRPTSGYREINPDGEYSGEFSDAEAKNLRTNSLVRVTGGEAAAETDEPKSDLDLLRDEAAGLGVEVDEAWSVARLRKEIKKATPT